MNKKYTAITIFLLAGLSFSLAAQTKDNIPAPKSQPVPDTAKLSEKTALPQGQKAAPEIFYIIADKPVDYDTYRAQLQKKATQQ